MDDTKVEVRIESKRLSKFKRKKTRLLCEEKITSIPKYEEELDITVLSHIVKDSTVRFILIGTVTVIDLGWKTVETGASVKGTNADMVSPP